tara:strand:+ start:10 stop:267 length:258 start_codon:yes stop_codon:yes gene_type:complete
LIRNRNKNPIPAPIKESIIIIDELRFFKHPSMKIIKDSEVDKTKYFKSSLICKKIITTKQRFIEAINTESKVKYTKIAISPKKIS